MRKSDVDKIIHTQLIIARMGEKELMNWWNTDIAYDGAGGDFLNLLLGNVMAPLAAGEGILKAAQLKAFQLVGEMPDNQRVYSLFQPEPEVSVAIEERLRHFKRYPEDLPENISQILDPKKDWSEMELADLVQPETPPEFTGTSFGKEIKKEIGHSMPDIMLNLASLAKTCERGSYVLSFYREK
jgi:hypothetical protein